MSGVVGARQLDSFDTPEELASVVRFLVGDEASYCNGEIWTASGAYA